MACPWFSQSLKTSVVRVSDEIPNFFPRTLMVLNLLNTRFSAIFCLGISPLKYQQHNCPGAYIQVGKIKNTGSQVVNTNVHKIGNMPVIDHPVNNITQSARAY